MRRDINRAAEMEVFIQVVELGGFSAAAKALGMTPSAVSKLVARLESRLGARLFNRSTRRLQLTPEGGRFFERSLRILADLKEAELEASADATPSGRLRVTANVPFGRRYLLPIVGDFLARHPAVTLDLVLTDTVLDLLEARMDVAIRSGELKSSRLVARKLGETRMTIVGAPSYLERFGRPRSVAELRDHNRMGFCFTRTVEGWPLIENGKVVALRPAGNIQANDGETLRQLVLNGLGLARLAAFQVEDDIAAGRLMAVLEDHNPGDSEPVHAVYVGQGAYLPVRVRAFMDHLIANIRIT